MDEAAFAKLSGHQKADSRLRPPGLELPTASGRLSLQLVAPYGHNEHSTAQSTGQSLAAVDMAPRRPFHRYHDSPLNHHSIQPTLHTIDSDVAAGLGRA